MHPHVPLWGAVAQAPGPRILGGIERGAAFDRPMKIGGPLSDELVRGLAHDGGEGLIRKDEASTPFSPDPLETLNEEYRP